MRYTVLNCSKCGGKMGSFDIEKREHDRLVCKWCLNKALLKRRYYRGVKNECSVGVTLVLLGVIPALLYVLLTA